MNKISKNQKKMLLSNKNQEKDKWDSKSTAEK